MKTLHAAALVLLLGSSMDARAQTGTAPSQAFTQQEQSTCQPDVFRLCNDFVPDEDQIAVCMKSKRKQLSPDCRKIFDAHMKKGAK